MSADSPSVAPAKLYEKISEMAERVIKFIGQHRPWTVPQELTPTLSALAAYLSEGGDPLMALATLHDAPKEYLAVDLASTTIFSVKVGIGLRYTNQQLVELGTSALFHDIGMLDDEIVERLTGEQPMDKSGLEIIKRHVVRSRELLESHGLAEAILKGVEQHHERRNGQGYPAKISEDKIHSYAAVVGICDAYENLIHRRPFRPTRIMPSQAVRTIAESGQQSFPTQVLEAFLNQITPFPAGSFVQLSSGDFGKVVELNKGEPLRPWVEIFSGADGRRLTVTKSVDLSSQSDLTIKESVG